MLFRNAEKRFVSWKKRKDKKALLVTGARQIGKTYLIREFGNKNYKNFVEINFIKEPKAKGIFEGKLDAETIVAALTAYVRRPLVPNETLIFFDEVQECPLARTAIKFLVEDGRFDYAQSGSLLGVDYKEVPSYPVGFEERIEMYPLDFEEFAIANGLQESTKSYLKECFKTGNPVNNSAHDTMSELFRYYNIIGGMPEVVQDFVDTHDIGRSVAIQKDILALYRQDITKYAASGKLKIRNIFDKIPAELNAQNKRFMLTDLSKSARMNRYESSFVWLSDAGVALPCYNISEPKIPLSINEKSSLFKLYMCDTGLLCAACVENVQYEILSGNLSVNMGSIFENAFAQELKSAGFNLRYMNKKRVGEIDFILSTGGKILPVGIKSGGDYKQHKALDNMLAVSEWGVDEAIVFCMGNSETREKIKYLPAYMYMFLKSETIQPGTKSGADLSERLKNLKDPSLF